jgi:putative membrane protein
LKKHLRPLATAAVFGLLSLPAGFAQTAKTGTANRMTMDSTFATKAAQGGMAEVKLGELAKDHAQSDEVKNFGQQMVTDHTKANDELKSIAAGKNITLPTDLNAKDKATYDRLSKLSGAAFDRAYMRDMVADHRTDVSEFRKQAKSGTDPDLKAFASKTLPTLEHHLQMAESAEKAVKTEKK